MPIQNSICRAVDVTAVSSGFGVGFGVSTVCRNLRRRSRRELRHCTQLNWRLGRPVASAHRSMPCARALALLQQNEAAGLRALAHVSASFDCNSSMLWPATHCGRSWVPRWLEQKNKRRAKTETACGHSANTFPKMPAARTAPDRRPTPSLCSVVPQAGGRARFALKKHRISRAWERSFSCRSLGLAPASLATGFSQRWGASFALRRLGAAHCSLRPCGGLRKLRKTREVLAAFAPVARAPSALLHGAGCVRSPEFPP
jgi:hypothetical protein